MGTVSHLLNQQKEKTEATKQSVLHVVTAKHTPHESVKTFQGIFEIFVYLC